MQSNDKYSKDSALEGHKFYLFTNLHGFTYYIEYHNFWRPRLSHIDMSELLRIFCERDNIGNIPLHITL